MDRKNRLIVNTALLTAVSLIMRCIGMAWQVWLVSRIGAGGIGLFTLVLSVGSMAATFAISGIRFTSTRLISEELGANNTAGVSASVSRCLAYALFFGVAGMLILLLTAERIGFLWIGDARTVLSLEIYSFSLPFISLSAVFSGYFTSTGRVYKSAAVQLCEQLLQVAITAVFLMRAPLGDLEKCCAAVIGAGVVSQTLSFGMLFLLYLNDRRIYQDGGRGPRLTSRMLHIAMPLALSAYARTSLNTLQQMLVPRGLRASGLSADTAMADYGIIQGMAFPIVSFPSCFLLALSELLVPELTEAQVAGRQDYISRATGRLLEKCLLFSVFTGAMMLTFCRELGMLIYSSSEAGYYIGLLAILSPIMYMDMITDGCLKGLGQMMYSMSINVADSLLCIVLVILLLPRFGLMGYVAVIFISELINFLLSMMRLRQLVSLKLNYRNIFCSLVCAAGASQFTRFTLNLLGIEKPGVGALILSHTGAAIIYILLLRVCAEIKKSRN